MYKLCYQSDRRHLSRAVSVPRKSISRTTFPSPFFYAYIGLGCNLLLLLHSQACGEEPTFILFLKLRIYHERRGQWTRLC